MTPFECFQLYVALKNHFTKTTFNFHKYNGKVKVSVAQFQQRNDRYYFEKLAKHSDPKGLLISNLISNQQMWIGDLFNDQKAQDNYIKWKSRIDRFSYVFKQEITQFADDSVENICRVQPNSHPIIITKYLQGKISLETLVVISDCVGCIKYWNTEMRNDIVWDHVGKLVVKYKPFLTYDRQKFREIVKQTIKVVDDKQKDDV